VTVSACLLLSLDAGLNIIQGSSMRIRSTIMLAAVFPPDAALLAEKLIALVNVVTDAGWNGTFEESMFYLYVV
jgi:hypothetical protein